MEPIEQRGSTRCTTKVGLAAGTTTTITLAADAQYAIGGKAYKYSAASNQATPTTDIITGAAFVAVTAGYGCTFVVGLNAAGAIKVAQGPLSALDSATDGATALFADTSPAFPSSLPADFCPVGYIVTKVGASGSSWTFGSSNLAGPPSNVLHTFVDVQNLPSRPQIS